MVKKASSHTPLQAAAYPSAGSVTPQPPDTWEQTRPAGQWDISAFARRFPFIIPEAVLPDLVADTKEHAMRALIGALAEAGAVDDAEQERILSALLYREELASTAIGRGAAVPHTKCASVSRVVGAAACCRRGVDFGSLDGRPVHWIFMLLSPPGDATGHLRALEAICREVLAAHPEQSLANSVARH